MINLYIGKRCGAECYMCACGRDHYLKCKWADAKGWKLKVVRNKKLEKKNKKKRRK